MTANELKVPNYIWSYELGFSLISWFLLSWPVGLQQLQNNQIQGKSKNFT